MSEGAVWLSAAAAFNAAAALLHVACIFWGADGYRLLGAGEHMAALAAKGQAYPALVTAAVGGCLSLAAVYCASGAGLLPALPFLRGVLAIIASVYAARAMAFPWLKSAFPGNSDAFWLVSSAICLGIAMIHAVGLMKRWPLLSP